MDHVRMEVQKPSPLARKFSMFVSIWERSLQGDELVTLEMVDGQVHVKEQITEYTEPGSLLEDWNYLDFFLGTYDGKCLKEKTTKQGRPGNTRVWEFHSTGRCRVILSPGHETMPYFPCQWFPARDDPENNELFEACILAMLTPWRRLSDLKDLCRHLKDSGRMRLTTFGKPFVISNSITDAPRVPNIKEML